MGNESMFTSIRNTIGIKSQMTLGFQQKSITKEERVFNTTRTRQLNISFEWFEVFRFCNGVVWKLSSRKKTNKQKKEQKQKKPIFF